MREQNADNVIYKKYASTSGDVLELSKEDFDRIVELFKILYKQDQKLELPQAKSMQFEHAALSPEKAP